MIPSTPADNEDISSHPALISHPNDILPSKEASSLIEEYELISLTSHEIKTFTLDDKDIKGNVGKLNVNILRDSFQIPLREVPVLPIIVLPKSESIIISLIGFPFNIAT